MNDSTEQSNSDLPLVAHIESYTRLVINQGEENGIKRGQRFLVFNIGTEIFDPRTKESLGRLESVRGTGKVVHLQRRIATIESDMTIPGTKTVKKPEPPAGFSGLASIYSQRRFIEEEQSPPVLIGFADAQVGDFAKRV